MIASSVLEDDQDRLQDCIRSLEKPGDSVNLEYRVRHTDGTILHIMGNIKLLEEDGELVSAGILIQLHKEVAGE